MTALPRRSGVQRKRATKHDGGPVGLPHSVLVRLTKAQHRALAPFYKAADSDWRSGGPRGAVFAQPFATTDGSAMSGFMRVAYLTPDEAIKVSAVLTRVKKARERAAIFGTPVTRKRRTK